MEIAIIGAGIAGLSAANDLLAAGHKVTLFEAADQTGGLARGFQDETWDWPLEHFYHHIFEGDDAIIDLSKELGIGASIFFPTPRTSLYHDGKVIPFSNPIDWWQSGLFNPFSYVRYGLVGAFLRFTKFWRYLEKHTADRWMRRWYGKRIYNDLFKPLLIGKFGRFYQDVNMAWMWARLHVRSFKLGYFEGGFQAFIDRLTDEVVKKGGDIRPNCAVNGIVPLPDERLSVLSAGGDAIFDKVLHTSSPALLAKFAPTLPADYLSALNQLDSMAAVVVTLALEESLLTDGTYWLNLPAVSAEKSQNPAPFLALVEHTNYIDRDHYGGDHIIYIGDYVPQDHAYMQMDDEDLIALFVTALPQFNQGFDPAVIRKAWVHRASYAQPVPKVNQSRHVPAIQTPLANLYMANMSQVYPWDRGTNYAVEIGRKAAAIMLGNSAEKN